MSNISYVQRVHGNFKEHCHGMYGESYLIIKDFETKVGHTRHSMLVKFKVLELKKIILEKWKGFKNLNDEKPLRWVFIKHDMTPLTKKENDRLYKKFRELRDIHKDSPDVEVKLRYGKLYVNADAVDEFRLSNQIF